MRPIALIVGVLAVTMAVAGCGGDSDDGTAAASISKAEFVKKADAVCTKGGKQTEAKFEAYAKEKAIPEGTEPTSAQTVEVTEDIVIPALREQIDEVRSFGVPTADKARISAFLDDIDAVIAKAEEDPKRAARTLTKELARADRQIQGYFKVCGQQE